MDTYKGVWETPKNFIAKTFTGSRGHMLPYRMLVPALRQAQAETRIHELEPKRLPLVLLLHGSCERGNDNSTQLQKGVAELLGSETAAARFPCFYVVPQCAKEYRWVEADWDADRHALPLESSVPLSTTMELLDELLVWHAIDPQRVYLVGLSMGGFGVWDLLSRWPEYFAAALSVCGGADENAAAVAQAVPVWAFHGACDPIVPVERSRTAVAALQAAGGAARYTEYPHVGHDAWTYAFAEPDLLPWLFSHRRATTIRAHPQT